MNEIIDIQSKIKGMITKVIASSIKSVKCKDQHFLTIEKKIMSDFMEAAAETIGHCLSMYDMECQSVEYDERNYEKSSRNAIDYFTCAGKVRVTRSLYRNKLIGKSICPLNLNAGIVQKNWTPQAAKIATLATAEMTPYMAETLFQEMGAMAPSKSSLDRLPKRLNLAQKHYREQVGFQVRQLKPMPEDTAKIAISLDGVHIPIQKLKGKSRFMLDRGFSKTRGEYHLIDENYSPYREASCGTISYLNKDGERLQTHYYGLMPEEKKATLKYLLESHIKEDIKNRPDLELIAIADGAKDNWTYIDRVFPNAISVLDFYHAAEHLKKAVDAVCKNPDDAMTLFEQQRSILRHQENGIDSVIEFLENHQIKGDTNTNLIREINYFKSNRHRCKYHESKENKHPIGSGIVEAACKSLVTKRLKCSGMAWRWRGGEAILYLRSYVKSGLFDELWEVISSIYRQPVYP